MSTARAPEVSRQLGAQSDAPAIPATLFWPHGNVFGVLLNDPVELDSLGEQLTQAPYKAAPCAPVLYVKTANTWSRCGADIEVPTTVPQVEVGATVAMVIGPAHWDLAKGGAAPSIAGFVLLNDVSVPHGSFFRPPVRFKCLDGFLGVGQHCVPPGEAGDPRKLVLDVRIDGVSRQRVEFDHVLRDTRSLLRDVSDFMTLRPGDLLMMGCGAGRPLAAVGDRIEISVAGRPAFGTLSNTLVAAPQEAA